LLYKLFVISNTQYITMADHDEIDAEEQIAPKDPRFPLKVVYCPGNNLIRV